MAQFKPALEFILKHEGSTLFHDTETGERSRYGITAKLLAGLKYKITDPDLLTPEDVTFIYTSVFWAANHLDKISSQLVANKLFDMIINMRYGYGVRLLQASLNSLGPQCVIDGQLGPHTLITVNQFLLAPENEFRLLEELRLKSLAYYKQIAVGINAKFLHSWTTRANEIGIHYDAKAFNPLRDGTDDKVIKG